MNEWRKPKVAGPIVVAAVGGMFVLSTAIVSAVGTAMAEPAAVDCGAQYRNVSDVLKNNPAARPNVAPDSQVEKQCHLNEFIDSLTPKAVG